MRKPEITPAATGAGVAVHVPGPVRSWRVNTPASSAITRGLPAGSNPISERTSGPLETAATTSLLRISPSRRNQRSSSPDDP